MAASSESKVSAAANAATDTVTLTKRKQEFAPVIYAGLLTGVTGSVVPTTLSGGKTISTLAEASQSQSQIQVDGFKSDPGQSCLISVTALGVTKTGAKAMYNDATGRRPGSGRRVLGLPETGARYYDPLTIVTIDSASARVSRTPADGLGPSGQSPAAHAVGDIGAKVFIPCRGPI